MIHPTAARTHVSRMVSSGRDAVGRRTRRSGASPHATHGYQMGVVAPLKGSNRTVQYIHATAPGVDLPLGHCQLDS
jgi:hypothetical protein